LIQPIAAQDVAAAVADTAVGRPLNGMRNVGGPRKITFEQLARDALAANGNGSKTVTVDAEARYFGALLATSSLVTPD
jgi:uncharacterized protein YbjT (DUF2867 family)